MREDSTNATNATPLTLQETHPKLLLSTRASAAIALLRAWREGDEAEQRETLAYLKAELDADRLSDRKLFPA